MKAAAPCGIEAADDIAFKRNPMIRLSLPQWTALFWGLHLFSTTQGQTLGAVTARQDASTIVISVADLQDANLEDLHYFYSTDAGNHWTEISNNCLTFEGANARWDVLNCLGVDAFEGTTVQFKVTLSKCEPVRFDGYTYRVVQIGSQCWFAENLRSRVYANWDAIPGDLTDTQWGLSNFDAQVVYSWSKENLVAYGRLYNWLAVSDDRGICPNGWHVPTDDEWINMETELGMSSSEAKSIRKKRGSEQGGLLKSSSSTTQSWFGTNSSGFSALPGGLRLYGSGRFYELGLSGYWWTSSSFGPLHAWGRRLESDNDYVFRNRFDKRNGFSVRCVRD